MKRFTVIALLFCLVIVGICLCESVAQSVGADPTCGRTDTNPGEVPYSPQSGREGVAPTALPVEGATQAPVIDTGDTAWMLVSIALVMLMTPDSPSFMEVW